VLKRELTVPGAERIWYVADAFRAGMTVEDIFGMNMIDPWFLVQIEDLIKDEEKIKTLGLASYRPRPDVSASSARASRTSVWPSCWG
jgi:carbamoyl-phosphate synthase large subunit